MITDRDITKLKEVFVTKEDLKNTEIGLEARLEARLVSKEDFSDLCIEVGELKQDLGEVKSEMQKGFDGLNVKIDTFLGTVEDVQMDNAAGAVILYRHERQIELLAAKAEVILPQD